MLTCHSCGKTVSATAKFCKHCGAPMEAHLDEGSPVERTYLVEKGEEPNDAGSKSSSLSGSLKGSSLPAQAFSSDGKLKGDASNARFPLGTILAGRFRIVGLLGQGGMGEVYRADDLTLGQAVALKFLPQDVALNQQQLDLLYNEVRLARTVSHPNVCRVYDVGEVDGHHFLSMEFVDGEDLASLLRRIGRLSTDKGVEFARQICGGLYAAHEKGVVHLDLKPSNIMIDGRGKVRITDFGLARLAESAGDLGSIVGTPAYMSPEQLAGGAVGEHSDIYSLGLTLHEMFTGKPVFRAGSIAELIRIRDQVSPSRLSGIVREIDPAVDGIIQRCLEKDPGLRPANVVQVAAALPGGDPLAAAIAAGEIPSPELVAASGGNGGLAIWKSFTMLGSFMLLIALSVFLTHRSSKVTHSDLKFEPQVLEARALEIYELLGVESDHTIDSGYGYWYNPDQKNQSNGDWPAGGDAPLEFWYRAGSTYLTPQHPFLYARQPRQLTLHDPPPTDSGMVSIRLTGSGLLREASVVPYLTTPVTTGSGLIKDQTWGDLFDAAGFDITNFTETKPRWESPWPADQIHAWESQSYTEAESTGPIRIEAAERAGRICYFQVMFPWTSRQWTVPTRQPEKSNNSNSSHTRFGEIAQDSFFFLIGGPLLLVSMLLAARNVKAELTDSTGALRFAAFMLSVDTILGILESHHNLSFGLQLSSILSCLVTALGRTVRFYIYYLALEPYVRKLWPHVLIGWNRLVGGRFSDPLIAREVMIGALLGTLSACVSAGASLIGDGDAATMLSDQPAIPDSLLGGQGALLALLTCLQNTLSTVFPLLVLVVFRLILRFDVLAVLAFTAVFSYAQSSPGDSAFVLAAIVVGRLIASLTGMRVGLLALMAHNAFFNLLTRLPVTYDLSAWYFPSGMLGFGVPLILFMLAFFIALGDRSPFRLNVS